MICNKNKIGFIYCLEFILSFYCFIDFGEHVISNLNNKEPKTFFKKNIEKGIKTKIIIDNELEEFILNEDDFIIFKEIKGMKQLLNGTKKQIKNLNNNVFEIEEDSTNYEDYIQGGLVQEVKEKVFLHNKSIEELIIKPEICEQILEENKDINLHIAFLALHEFYKVNKKLTDNNDKDLEKIIDIFKEIYSKNKNDYCKNIELDEIYLKDIFKYAKCEISPICRYGGGVVSQEIIKYTGIYKPINQWFRVEFIDILDKNIEHHRTIKGTRYDEQILIFGNETQKKLENLNLFLIGVGAVGCELLKYFAMMGISTNSNSLLIVTDHDRIEKSNISRKFLFREKDIFSLKSECAINSVKK